MFGLKNPFGNKTKETTPAGAQAHSLPARILIRTAALAALFGIQYGSLWLSDHWVDNPLSNRLSRRLSRMAFLGAGTVLGSMVYAAIARMVRDSESITIHIPESRNADGTMKFEERTMTFAGTPDLAQKMDDLLAGHDGKVTIELKDDKNAKVTLAKSLFDVRELLGIHEQTVDAMPTIKFLQARLNEIEAYRGDAEAFKDVRNILKLPENTSSADVTQKLKDRIAVLESMEKVVIEITGKTDSTAARELRRMFDKAKDGIALPEGFSYDAAKNVLVYKSGEGRAVETPMENIYRSHEVAAQLQTELSSERIEVSHEGGGMYQIRIGADRTPQLMNKVRGKAEAERVRTRIIAEQVRGKLGPSTDDDFASRLNEIALAVLSNGQVPHTEVA